MQTENDSAQSELYGVSALMQCQHKVMNRPEEDEVSLVVEGDSSPSLEIWVLAEDGGKHAPKSMTQPGAKVVENELGSVRACAPMMLHVSHHLVSCLTQVRNITLQHLLECTAQPNAMPLKVRCCAASLGVGM